MDVRPSVYIVLWLFAAISSVRAQPEYIGCYFDEPSPRKLRGEFRDFSNSMTPQRCSDFCKDKGYLYAGLQYRTQCFCGDETPKISDKMAEADCNAACSGDDTKKCGGDWRNSVYKTGFTDALINDESLAYVGCFIDQEPRELKGYFQDFGGTNTPEKCVKLCKERGYVYAGLQYRSQCFCGDQRPKVQNRVSQGDCSAKCSGDIRYNCGADWRNSVYETGHGGSSVAVIGYEYLGCYKDQGEPRLLRGEMLDFPETLTPSLCVGICKKKGYAYAGLQFSSQCFCGDNEIREVDKVNEDDCNYKCKGDLTTICGGVWRNTVYKTGNPAASIAVLPGFDYLGCYKDQAEPRLLQDYMQTFPDTLIPQLCVALCKRKGYIYAGLQFSSQCFCGDQTPPDSARADEIDCSARCSGHKSTLCGGTWRNTVYKTGNTGSSVADIGYMYLGCYRDQGDPRNLVGYFQDFPETLTPQHCVTICNQRKFLFAGLQYGSQCFCGNGYPSPSDKMPESDCNAKCTGNLTTICGGTWRNTIYSTASSNENKVTNICEPSVTVVNGKPACRNAVVFEDTFESLSPEKWSHIIKITNEPDYQFVIFNSKPENAYISNGKLTIKPTLLPDSEVKSGDLHFDDCTGKAGTDECGYKARSYIILPPVQSARLTTRKSFAFRFGKVEISARLPLGDWLVPELWLDPKDEVYGPGYASGRIRLAMSRGNKDLKLDGTDIGCKQLESGLLMGVGDNIRGRAVIRETEDGWYKQYHNYTVVWTPDNIIFTIDGEHSQALIPSESRSLSNIVGFDKEVVPVWSSASKIAPFDNDFYITLGLSTGGVRDFPDNCLNHGNKKPWKNLELKALLNFWRDKSSWKDTWQDGTSSLDIDYVKVTAL